MVKALGVSIVDWTAVTAIAAVAQALILAIAAWFAWRQVKEAKALRGTQTRPYVIAYLRLHSESLSVVEMVVENIGATPAEDVHVEISPPFESSLDQGHPGRVSEWGLIAHGVAQIAPHQQLSTFADVLHSRFAKEDLRREYTVTITYRDSLSKEEWIDTSRLDFNAFHMMHYTTTPTLRDLVDPVKKIASTLDHWSGRLGVPGIVVLTRDYQEAVDEVLERWGNRASGEQSPVSEAASDEAGGMPDS